MTTIFIIVLLVIAILLLLALFFKKPAKAENVGPKIDAVSQNMTQNFSAQRQEFSNGLANQQDMIYQNLSALTESINDKFDRQFKDLQESNEKKLTQIQQTVDEKLQETLNRRISQSFEQVTNLLNNVNKGLGEMRTLASDVDSLQKVMTGVKTRGIIGEIQLNAILEQSLTKSQYREQVNIQGNNRADFAVVMPGKTADSEVLLPIDSKFPMENYQRLQLALDAGDKTDIDSSRKALFADIRTQAKSISEKYILPPKTTDFAMMFLPTEGLFMEVVNNPELYEQLSRDYKVNITGPTTMTAVLSSLQMGFKTLQIGQKSSEVYQMLGKVKTEFGKYETALVAVQKDLQKSNKDIDALITTRTNMMNRQLRDITAADSLEMRADEGGEA